MIKKSLARGLLFAGCLLIANLASALSLGEMTLHSALNEPLRASIPFKDAADLSENQIIARLASVEDFEKAGVDFAYFLTDLKFAVEVDGQGGGVIKVSTDDPIVEPYLDFLLEARWPSGRMLREYTVLLDLPIIAEGATAAVETAEGGVVSQAAETTKEPAPAEETVVVEEEPPVTEGIQPRTGLQRRMLPATGTATEYRVQHDDTLWEIAARFRPSEEISVQQTMLALLRNNPEAFIDGNVNRLKSGYVLRLPSADEAAEVAFDEAVREVKRQNDIWVGKSVGEPAQAPQVMATDTMDVSEPDAGAEPDARLSIATPGEDEVSEGAAGGAAEGSSMRNALAASEENLEKVRRENEELSSRLEDLESQLATLQRLLQLKDDQLAALQAQQAAGEQEPAVSVEETRAQASATEEAEPVEEIQPQPQPGDEAASEPEATIAETTEPEEQAPPQPGPQTQSEPEKESITDLLGTDRQLLMNIALAVVILLVLVLLMRFLKQRREAREEEERLVASHLEDIKAEGGEAAEEPAAVEGKEELAAETAAEPAESKEEKVPERELEQLLDEEPSSTEELLGGEPEAEAEPVEAETGDAIAEAEIYVAYGRYDQAVELLKNAIAKEPQRTDLRAKLLAVYLETRDKDSFLSEYEALEAMGDQAALSQVRDSMSAMEGVSDWLRDKEPSPSEVASPVEEPAASGEDEETDEFAGLELDEPETGSAEELEFDLDLEGEDLDLSSDLDFELETSGDEEKEGESAETELEFDLDLEEGLGAGLKGENEEEPEPLKAEEPQEEAAAEPEKESEEFSLDVDLDSLDKDLDSLGGDLDLEKELGGDLDLGGDFGEELTTEEETPAEEEPSLEFPEEQPATETEAPRESELADLGTAVEGEEMDDFGLLGESDEVSTKLDLARAYIDMGDNEGAREMLQEVMQEGDDAQKQEASSLLERL